MRRAGLTWAVALGLVMASEARAIILASSYFSSGTEGWRIVGDPGSTYPSFGGSYIYYTDTSTQPEVFYFKAPAAFLGDKREAYGCLLTFKWQTTGSYAVVVATDDVMLTGGGITLTRDLPSPSASWSCAYVQLDETSGWMYGSRPPTKAEFQTVLNSISQLLIRGEYRSGTDTGYLDNVVMYGDSTYGYPVLPTNGSFETAGTTTGPLPDEPGYWRGDNSSIVTSTLGITPKDGVRMLRFIYTGQSGPSSAVGSELFQILDVNDYRREILTGAVVVAASAWFNRVSGDAQTDTSLGVTLAAYAGTPCSFADQWYTSELATATGSVLTDGNLSTWQEATVELRLPAATDFAVIRVYALENVYNDTTGTEFDGHFADAVSINVYVDCNDNGVPDLQDITGGTSEDCNSNATPDDCEVCGDLDQDGDVDDFDFASFVVAFGRSVGDPLYDACADYDADGTVTLIDYQAWLECYRARSVRDPGRISRVPPGLGGGPNDEHAN